MSITNELQKLKQVDIWSLMLFVLYKFQHIPEYSSLSELCYILDEKSLLKLCEYFGGQTIKIPTIDELEETLYAMLIYQYVDVEKLSESDAFSSMHINNTDKQKQIKACYKELKNVLTSYNIQTRDKI